MRLSHRKPNPIRAHSLIACLAREVGMPLPQQPQGSVSRSVMEGAVFD
jgi:hypothetical protein